MVQWLRHSASTAGDMNLIPGQGSKIPHAIGQLKKACAPQRRPNAVKITSNNNKENTIGGREQKKQSKIVCSGE